MITPLATVFWDSFEGENLPDVEKAMEKVKGKLRSLLAKALKVRSVPKLSMKRDTQFFDEQRVEKLLASPSAAAHAETTSL